MKSTAFWCPALPGLRDPMATKSFTYVHARCELIVGAMTSGENVGAGEAAAAGAAAVDGEAASAGCEFVQPSNSSSPARMIIVRDIRSMIRGLPAGRDCLSLEVPKEPPRLRVPR